MIPAKVDLTILSDFPSFAVVEKPCGLLSVPGLDRSAENMVNLFRSYFSGTIAHPEVHRLDQETSGILLFAKNQRSHKVLSAQFAQRMVKKEYTALLDGIPSADSGVVQLAFRSCENDRHRQVFDPIRGKVGITEWRVISVEYGKARVLLKPVTGRTHQLRVHALHPFGIGVPICGDSLYGSRSDFGRLCLHASGLTFYHPENGEILSVYSSAPF